MLARFPTLLALPVLIALALPVLPGDAAATGVTTNSYDASSTDSDIRKSCEQMRVSSAGTLTGRCNSNSVDTTIDLTAHVGCHNNTKEPFWAANQDPADTNWSYLASGQAKGVETGSNGKSYYLKANCGSTDMELPLSRRITNSGGSFAHSSTNVW